MMSSQFLRYLHLNSNRVLMGANKSNLAKLRKKTGYPFGNCKKALEANNNDLEKAEKWLEEQAKVLGWSKSMKMENRSASQGLVGIAWDWQHAAMVELNCETDFVAKNDKFQKLVDVVAKTCLHHTKKNNSASANPISKVLLEGSEVGKLTLDEEGESLADQVARGVATVGERLVLRRAVLMSAAPPNRLSAHTHPAQAPTHSLLGKYGAVMVYTAPAHDGDTAQLARQLCQHVIGMNPSTIEGSPDDPPKMPVEPKQPERVQNPIEGEEDDEGLLVHNKVEEETAMLRQSFLLEPDRMVADILTENSLKIEDFVRFECGENLAETDEESPKVAAAGGG